MVIMVCLFGLHSTHIDNLACYIGCIIKTTYKQTTTQYMYTL